jgi:hypothetical protein
MRLSLFSNISIGRYLLIFIAVFMSVLFLATDVSQARTAPRNDIETERKALCGTSSISIYGAVWINGSSSPSFAESLTVPWNATTVTAYMQTTAFMCSYATGSPRTNVRIVSLDSANNSTSVPVSFPSGTTINRGTMYRGEFSSTGTRSAGTPGVLRIRLNVSGLNSGNYTVRYSGVYADNTGTGLSRTYTTQLRLNRQPPPPSAAVNTYNAIRNSAGTNVTRVQAGQTVYLTSRVVVSGATNIPSGARFAAWYTNTGSVVNGVAVTPSNSQYSANETYTNGDKLAYTNIAFTPTVSQIGDLICRTARANQLESWASYTQRAGRCVRVVGTDEPAADVQLRGGGTTHEKGSGDKEYRVGIIGGVICEGTGGSKVVEMFVSINGGPRQKVGDLTVTDCVPITSRYTAWQTINASVLDNLTIGVNNNYQIRAYAVFNGTDLDNNEESIVAFEAPFARFYGNDITTCSANADNSFLFDDRTGAQPANAAPINDNKGAYSFYATLYENDKATELNGLHTIAGARDNLASSFGSSCSASPVTIEYRGDPVQPTPTGDINIASLAEDTFIERTDGFTVNGGDIGNDKITIKTTGDVVINGNITSNIVTGALDVDTAPALLIVTDGNIYITNNTNRVDAVLIAGGDIFTCSIGDSPVSRADWHLAPGSGGCANSLIVNGALNANTVHFMRSIGSRYLSNTSTAVPSNGAWQGNGIDQPAEIVNFPSYLNFTPTYTKDFSTQGYDSYVQLPPRL